MDCRPFEITLIGANDIKDVNMFSKMDVFAVVTVTGAGVAKQKHRTPVHKDGGTNPRWNHTIKLNLDDAALSSDRVKIKINLVSQRAMGDTKIGKAVIPAKELLLQSEKANNGGEKPVSYVIVTPKGRTKGSVSFRYKFGEKFTAAQLEAYKSGPAHEPVMAYPASHAGPSSGYPPQAYQAYPPQQAGYAYPLPQQASYGYAPPPQAGYGYAPQQAGYGYPPVVQPGYGYAQKPQKPKKGGNMALGLGAGLLGGLLIGDMVSDVGDMGAYDAGFGDGFDF